MLVATIFVARKIIRYESFSFIPLISPSSVCVLLLYYYCIIIVLLLYYYCIIIVLLLYYYCIIIVLLLYYSQHFVIKHIPQASVAPYIYILVG